MDMPFAFDDKLLFNLPEGYRGIWESDESEEDDDDDDIEPIEWKEPVCKIVLSDYERSKQEYQFSCSVSHIERDASDYKAKESAPTSLRKSGRSLFELRCKSGDYSHSLLPSLF